MFPSRTLRLAATLSLACLPPALHAQAPSPQLSAVLAQMDASSRSFQSATADFDWTFVERVAGMTDTTRQTGSMFLERAKGGIAFGAAVYDMGDNGKPSPQPSKIIDFSGGTAQIYTPGVKQEDIFKAGNNKSSFEGYLSLGFGGSGHDLASTWGINDGGPVQLMESGHPVKTEKLILVSKDASVRNTFKQVTIWIDPARDVSLKQVFDLPDGDQRTALYTNLRLNGKVNRKPYEIPSKGVTVIPH